MEIKIGELIIDKDINLGSVTIDAVKVTGVFGSKTIEENGIYNAIDDNLDGYDKVTVDVPVPKLGNKTITENGTYEAKTDNLDGYDKVDVDVYVNKLGTKTITTNGTYKATDDNVDGYSEVVVSTSGVDINDYYDTNNKYSGDIRLYIKEIPMINTENLTTMYQFFSNCQNLTNIPKINTSNVTNMNIMFLSCRKLKTIPALDTSKVTGMSRMFNRSGITIIPELNTSNVRYVSEMFSVCLNLITIPKLNFESVTNISSFLSGANNVVNIGGFENLGAAYSTTSSANYSYYRLDLTSCTKLTHESLMNVINNLYDIKTKGCKVQSLRLGATNLAKLTDEEKQIAIDKSWNVS